MMNTTSSSLLLNLPPEIILHIFSFLDLPDLATLSQLSPLLAQLSSDPALHRVRILVVAPSRVSHSLFGKSSHGLALRPTVGDLVHRGVIRGLGITRRWRMGIYIYSPHSVAQYEDGKRLQRSHACAIVSSHLHRRSSVPGALQTLLRSRVLPDVESSSLAISRSLLPVMHKLKWSLKKDQLAKMFRSRTCTGPLTTGNETELNGFGKWLEMRGRVVVQEGERVRLAVCPGVRHIVEFYEELAREAAQ